MRTEIVFLLDRSGSMSGLEKDTIGGYNSFIKKQKKEEGKAFVTTVLFDDRYEVLHDRVDIKELEKLTEKDYFARGMTSLLDAVGKTINDVNSKILGEKEETKVIFVITTDGEENSSVEYGYEKVKNMIENKSDWQFIFLGANIDAVSEASKFGISAQFASNYKATGEGTKVMYNVMSDTVASYRANGSIDDSWRDSLEEEDQED